jgi:leucyl-tRNA synthetase
VEPFRRLFTQGMIYKDGAKMSKSKGNVVGIDEMTDRYGADTARTFTLFIGPPDQDAEWSDAGVEGIFRFLGRLWRLFAAGGSIYRDGWRGELAGPLSPAAEGLRRKTHQTIRKVTQDIERFHFNTAVSALMELVNVMGEAGDWTAPAEQAAFSEALENLSLILAPLAPHLAEEFWQALGKTGSVCVAEWPAWDDAAAREVEVTIVVQVNGKVRDRLQVPADTPEAELRELARASERARAFYDGKTVRQVIVVPNKLVNIVAS